MSSNDYSEDGNYKFMNIEDKDAQRIVNKVNEFGRLDKLLDIDKSERARVFSSKRILVNAMYSLSYAKPHKERMMSEFIKLPSGIDKIIYTLCAGLYSQGFKLSFNWLSAFTNKSQIELEEIISKMDSSIIRYEKGEDPLLSFQSRSFAEDFMDSKNLEDSAYNEYKHVKIETVKSFLSWIVGYIDSRNPNFHSRYYRASSRLLSYSLLTKWFTSDEVEQLYKHLRSYWQDNARFWEQYALLSIHNFHYEEAIAYARQATKIYSDAFTLNTLGMVLMKSSYSYVSPGSDQSIALLKEGISYLHKSRESRRGDDYPYTTFFAHARQYLSQTNVNKKLVAEELNGYFLEWMYSARHHVMFNNPRSQHNLRNIQLNWIKELS